MKKTGKTGKNNGPRKLLQKKTEKTGKIQSSEHVQAQMSVFYQFSCNRVNSLGSGILRPRKVTNLWKSIEKLKKTSKNQWSD